MATCPTAVTSVLRASRGRDGASPGAGSSCYQKTDLPTARERGARWKKEEESLEVGVRVVSTQRARGIKKRERRGSTRWRGLPTEYGNERP